MVIFACIVIFVTSYFIGGIGTINSMVEAQDPGLGWSSFFNGPFFGPFTGPAIMISLGLFTLGPQISKLWFCLDEERHVPHTILTYMVFMTLMFFMMLLAGLGARAVLPSIQPDLSSLLIISKFMPAPVVAFAGVGVIAAIMSTTAGLFLVIAIGIVNDIYKDTLVPHLWPNMSPATTDKRALLGTRILIPIVMIIGILISFHPPKLLTALIWVGLGGFTAAFAPVMVWGCLWRRTTKAGVITASIVGFACHCICYFVLGKIVGMSLFLVPWAGCGIGIIAGFILCPIVSLFTKPFSEEHLKVCFERQTDKESVGE
jgi:Na+/proline symporter